MGEGRSSISPGPMSASKPPQDLDERSPRRRGFAELGAGIQDGDHSQTTSRWRGRGAGRLFLAPVQSESPALQLDARGSCCRPRSCSAPIRSSAISNGLAVLFTLSGRGRVHALRQPADRHAADPRLLERFQDIAGGDADLTRRVEVRLRGRDRTARRQLQHLCRRDPDRCSKHRRPVADALTDSSDEMRNLSQQIASANEETSTQASMVSAAAEQVSANVQSVATATEELNANTREIAASASEAAQVANRAVDIADRHEDHLRPAGRERQHHRQCRQGHLRDRGADQPAGAECDHRGCAGRRGRQGLRGGRRRGQETRQPDRAGHRGDQLHGGRPSALRPASRARRSPRSATIISKIHDIQTTIASGVEEQTATTAEIAHSVTEAATGSGEIAERIAGIAAAVQQTAIASTSSHERADRARPDGRKAEADRRTVYLLAIRNSEFGIRNFGAPHRRWLLRSDCPRLGIEIVGGHECMRALRLVNERLTAVTTLLQESANESIHSSPFEQSRAPLG